MYAAGLKFINLCKVITAMQYDIKTMSQDEINQFLAAQKMGFLSLTDGETPYAIPLAYFYDDGCIHITIRPEGRKMAYIRRNKNVCFSVCWVPEGFVRRPVAGHDGGEGIHAQYLHRYGGRRARAGVGGGAY